MADEVEQRTPNPRNIALVGVGVVLIGVFFYHIVEDLSFIDSLYFSVITLTTIGYGDIVPKTDLGKIFTSVYVIVGIAVIGAVVNFLLRRAAVQRFNLSAPQQKLDQEHTKKS